MYMISDIEAAVLGLLCERPQYAYDLDRTIEERGMRNWTQIGFSSIYYVLKRMEKSGLVQGVLEPTEGKPSRRNYTVTEQGRAAMKEKVIDVLSGCPKLISPFDLGMANIDALTPDEAIGCLSSHIDALDERARFLERGIAESMGRGDPYHVTVLFEIPLVQLEAERELIERMIIRLERGERV
jgi:DNA-binding PadR family transcriptional regulator